MFSTFLNYLSFFFLTVWSNVAAIEVKIPEQVYEAVNGSDTTIPCKFETSVENPQSGVISWFRRDLNSSARNVSIKKNLNTQMCAYS